MKKCVQCRSNIDKMVPFVVCCGGAPPPAPSAPSATIMNNGRADNSIKDVQKLQQQLQDIKDQVFLFLLLTVVIQVYSRVMILTISFLNRRAAPCVWIG